MNGAGERLREIREQAGLSLTEVARRAGVDVGNLCAVEHGKLPLAVWPGHHARAKRPRLT